MLRNSLLILTLSSSIYAANAIEQNNQVLNNSTKNVKTNVSKNEKYQIYADDIKSKNNVVTATGNVVIFSKSYYMTAEKVVYDKNNETFELFEKVVILKDNNLHTNSNYTFINMKSNKADQKPTLIG